MSRAVILVGLAAALLLARPADAGRCTGGLGWTVTSGSLSPGARCGSVVLTSDGSGSQSIARAYLVVDADAVDDIAWTVTVRRLTADEGSLQLSFPGGWLVLTDGAVGIYHSEEQWTQRGFEPLTGALADYRLVDQVTVRLELRGDQVAAQLDGIEVGRWTVPSRARTGMLGVWVLGPRGVRARALVRDPVITALGR